MIKPCAVALLLLLASCRAPSTLQNSTGQQFNSVPRSQFPALMECVFRKQPNVLGSSPGQAITLSNNVSDADWQNPDKLGPYAEAFQRGFDLAVQVGCL